MDSFLIRKKVSILTNKTKFFFIKLKIYPVSEAEQCQTKVRKNTSFSEEGEGSHGLLHRDLCDR